MKKVRSLLLGLSLCSVVFASGNHPESGLCTKNKPFYPICTHSLHNLEGWSGNCYKSFAEAQKEAKHHAKREHKDNMRWTGVKKSNSIARY